MNRKGFTLIELLAVIVIMGIFMTVTIYGGSTVINNSKKSLYVSNAKEFLKSAKYEILKNHKRYAINDTDVSYYIHINNFELEKNLGSPWGKWTDAYVVVGLTNSNKYIYAWTSKDEANYTIKLQLEDELTRDDVVQDTQPLLKEGIGNRKYIVVIGEDGVVQQMTTEDKEVTKQEAEKCFEYSANNSNKTATIISYKKSCGSEVDIPAKIDGYYVTTIGDYCFSRKELTAAFIPEGVKTIGNGAFQTNQLKSIALPQGLVTIGALAFDNNQLPEVIFPTESLKTIGRGSFQSNQLKSVDIPTSVETVGACAFCQNPLEEPLFLYAPNDYSTIIGYMGDLSQFTGNNFVIPATSHGKALLRIEDDAFRNFEMSGWTVTIPKTVTSIGDYAFAADGIKKVSIFTASGSAESNLKKVESNAFYNNSISELYIPSGVTEIGIKAFNRNKVTSGEKVIYQRSATPGQIDYSTIIGYSGFGDIDIPAKKNNVALTTIAESAYEYCYLTGTAVIPSTVTSIGNRAFALNKLTDINNGVGDNDSLPIAYVRNKTMTGGFDNTKLLSYGGNGTTSVTIPSSVTALSPYSFYYSQIKAVILPDNLTTIGANSFEMSNLTGTVTIPSKVTSIGANAFHKKHTWGCSNCNLTKIVNKTGNSFAWKGITAGSQTATFVTGTIPTLYGDIEVTSS